MKLPDTAGSPVRRASRRRRSAVAAAATALALWTAAAEPAPAELVILAGGHVLKVTGYHIDGDRALLMLPAGGEIELSLMRIEHIVDDEIVPASDPEPPAPLSAGTEIAYLDGQGVPQTPFGHLIHQAARRNRLNPHLVAAVVRAESGFDPAAVSPKGAAGLLQLMPATADRFGIRPADRFDPELNLQAGTRYLSWLVERFAGDLPRVLAGFNAGEATVERYDGVPPFRETREYIRRVYSFLGLPAADGPR